MSGFYNPKRTPNLYEPDTESGSDCEFCQHRQATAQDCLKTTGE